MRLKSLDILRGLAVILVLGNHAPTATEDLTSVIQFPLNCWKKIGWVGVDLFFVLSGFLVSGLLFREWIRYGSISVKRFLLRRAFKIYPAFFVYLAGLIALKTAYTGHSVDLRQVFAEVCFIQNYTQGIWTHTWSLAVEEHFYLLLAIFVVIVMKTRSGKGFRYLGRIYLAVLIVVLASRLLTISLIKPYSFLTHSTPTHLRIDSLLFGVLLSYYYHFGKHNILLLIKLKWLTLCCSILLVGVVALLPTSSFFVHSIGYTLLTFGFGGMLIVALVTSIPAWGWLKWIAWALSFIGYYSYSIYLWHMSANVWGKLIIDRILGPDHLCLITYVIYFVGSIVLGVIMAKLVELPMLKVRDKYVPSVNTPILPPIATAAWAK